MNINPIMLRLGESMSIPIEQDNYEGDKKIFLTFTIEDEEDAGYADNQPQIEICYIQISLYTPKNFNYIELKEKIKKFLRDEDFKGISSRSWTENANMETNYQRHTVFECHIMKGMEE